MTSLLRPSSRKLSSTTQERSFPIVCLGGSAGALDAYVRILRTLPHNSGLAIVIVNHCSWEQTPLQQILSGNTRMPVEIIGAGMRPLKDTVFIIPGNHDLMLSNGCFQISARSNPRGWPNVITRFLNSLAQEWAGPVVGVILSGMGYDGTAALQSVKAVGGINVAQSLLTAKRKDMPRSAIDTGYVDFVLSPEEIGDALNKLSGAGSMRLNS
jgi:chemotaxis response regulator CheB